MSVEILVMKRKYETEFVVGQKFGQRTVLAEIEPVRTKSGIVKRRVEVLCECGKEAEVDLHKLIKGAANRCKTCVTDTRVRKGMVFGKRTVISSPTKRGGYWRVFVRCSCGYESEITTTALLRNAANQCHHCRQYERIAREHGGVLPYPQHRPYRQHDLYQTWHGIKGRIFNTDSHAWDDYGGRGLTMHPEWVNEFGAFAEFVLTHLGPRPEGKSIDRVDNDLGYIPFQPNGELQLCWADQDEQNNNRRGYKGNPKYRWGLWRVGDVEGTLFKVCKHFGVFDNSVKNQLKRNHLREALTVKEGLRKVLAKKLTVVPEITCLCEPTEQPEN